MYAQLTTQRAAPPPEQKGRDADNLFTPQARPEARAPPRARTARRIPGRLQRGDHARAGVHGRFPGGAHPHRDGDYTDRARHRKWTRDGSRPREDHGDWAAGTRRASMALILRHPLGEPRVVWRVER